jgi:hypothetical protein
MATQSTLRRSRRLAGMAPENEGFALDKKRKRPGEIDLPAPKRRRVPKVRKYTFEHRKLYFKDRKDGTRKEWEKTEMFTCLSKTLKSAKLISLIMYFNCYGYVGPTKERNSAWWDKPKELAFSTLVDVEDVDGFVPDKLINEGHGDEANMERYIESMGNFFDASIDEISILSSLRMKSASTPLKRDGLSEFDNIGDGLCVINSLLSLCESGRLKYRLTKEQLIAEFNEAAHSVPYAQGGFLGSPEHGTLSVEQLGISSYVLMKWAEGYERLNVMVFTPDLSRCILQKKRIGSRGGGTSLAFAVDGTASSPHMMIADGLQTLVNAKHYLPGDIRNDEGAETSRIRDEAFDFRQTTRDKLGLPSVVNFEMLDDGVVMCDGKPVVWGEFLSRVGTVLTPELNLAPLLPSIWGATGRLAGVYRQKWDNGARLTQFSEKGGVTLRSYAACEQLLEFAPLVTELPTLDFNKCTLAMVARAFIQHTFPTHLPMARHAPETVALLEHEKVSGHRVCYFNPFEVEGRPPRVGMIDIRRAYTTACLTMDHVIPIPGEDDTILPWSKYPYGGQLRDDCNYWVEQRVIRPPLMGRYCKTNAATLRYICEEQGRSGEVRFLFFQHCSRVIEGEKLREVVSGMMEWARPTSSIAQKLLVNEWCGSNGRFKGNDDQFKHHYSEDLLVALSMAVERGSRAAQQHPFVDSEGKKRIIYDVCQQVPARATVARDSSLPIYEAVIWSSWVELSRLMSQVETLCGTHDPTQYAIDNYLEGPQVYRSPSIFILSTDCVAFIQPHGKTITARDLTPSPGWEYRDEPEEKVAKLRHAKLESTMSYAKCVRDNPRRMFESEEDLEEYKANFIGEFPEPLFVYRPNVWEVTECAPTAGEIESGEMGDFTTRTVDTVMAKVDSGGVFLTGVGGAGKSYVSAQVVKRLISEGRNVSVCTPIHKGCDVLARAFVDAGCVDAPVPETLHKLLRYHVPEQTEDTADEEVGTASASKLDCDVLLIDEISMIPRHMWGMLRLLLEANPRVKLMLVGDLCQHTPVIGEIDYSMRLLKHFVNFQQVLLTYNHRCQVSPNLHKVMGVLRGAIESGVDVELDVAWVPVASDIGDTDLHIVNSNHMRCHVNDKLMTERMDDEGVSVFLRRDPANVWGQDMWLYTDLPLLVRTSAELPVEGIRLFNGFGMKVVGLDASNELCLVRHEGGRIGTCEKKGVDDKYIAKLDAEVKKCRKRLDKVLEQQAKRTKASTRLKFQPEVDKRHEALRAAEVAHATALNGVGEDEQEVGPGHLTLTFASIARTCVPGYALTSYNSQGSTFVDDVQIHEFHRMDMRATYVALSRVKDESQLSMAKPFACLDPLCPFRPVKVTVYSITNDQKGLLYVGHVMDRCVKGRWEEHRACKTSEVGKALQEHGPDTFEFKVLKIVKLNSRVLAKHHEMKMLEKLIAEHPEWKVLNKREEATFDEEIA